MNPVKKLALVTGSSRRIGAAIVHILHANGYKVVIHCHKNLEQAHALANELNQQAMDTALVLQADLTMAQAAEELITQVKDWAGRLDLLVNNASIFQRDGWDELFAINAKAPYFLSLAAKKLLAQTQGSIVNISDIHAEKPLKNYEIYCQSKAALNMQTKALAQQFAPEIRVNAVAPGPNMWPEGDNSVNEEEKKRIIDKTLLKRFGSAKYVAQAVLALAQNEYITGQILPVDGGRSIA